MNIPDLLLIHGTASTGAGSFDEDISKIIKFIDNEISGKLCPEINYDET